MTRFVTHQEGWPASELASAAVACQLTVGAETVKRRRQVRYALVSAAALALNDSLGLVAIERKLLRQPAVAENGRLEDSGKLVHSLN